MDGSALPVPDRAGCEECIHQIFQQLREEAGPLYQDILRYFLLEELDRLNHLPCPVTAVRGNCDAEVDIMLTPFAVSENAWIEADALRIFASHGHRLPENPPLPGFAPGTVILRGHTHIPRGESLDGLHFWNPGSLSLPKGGFPRSYGLYEDGCFHVYDMEGKELLRHWPRQNWPHQAGR